MLHVTKWNLINICKTLRKWWCCWCNNYPSYCCSLMSCRIGRINSHCFKICMFCICHPTLEHCPLLSTPVPYLAPVKYTHVSTFHTPVCKHVSMKRKRLHIPLAMVPFHFVVLPARGKKNEMKKKLVSHSRMLHRNENISN